MTRRKPNTAAGAEHFKFRIGVSRESANFPELRGNMTRYPVTVCTNSGGEYNPQPDACAVRYYSTERKARVAAAQLRSSEHKALTFMFDHYRPHCR